MLFAAVTVVLSYGDTIDESGTDMSLEELVNVKISVASKTEETLSDAPGVISVITQDQLQRFGGTTLGDILKRVPSFIGTTVYFTDRAVISSRGDQVMPSSSHILLLINGRPIREILEGGIKSEVYESFPVNVIERIEIIRGPGSVLYGSQAVSAVINVVTKKAGQNSTFVSAMAGEKGHNNVAATVNHSFGDLSVVVAGRYADRGGWKVDWEAPNPQSANGIDVVRTKIPDYGPGVFMELGFREFYVMGSYNQWTNQLFIPDYQSFRGDSLIMPFGNATGKVFWDKMFGNAGYSHTFGELYNAKIDVTCTRSRLESNSFPWTRRDSYELLVEETNFFTLMDNLNLIAGFVYGFMTGTEQNTLSGAYYNSGHRQGTMSGYGQIDYRLKMCKFIAALQANKVEGFEVDLNPRFGIVFHPFENINVKTLYSTAYRAPSLDELYLDCKTMRGQMVDRVAADVIRKKNLEPEKIYTFDAGANYHSERVHFGFNAFKSRMKNLIFQDRDTSRYSIPTWDNLGEISIFGLECEGKYYLSREFMFEGSFLYQQSIDENCGAGRVSPVPDFSVKGGLGYKSDCGLTIGIFNVFHQALHEKYSSTLNVTTGSYNMASLHCVYDLSRFLNNSLRELSIVLDIDNLLDEVVWLPAWGLVDGSTIPYNEGRTVYGGFRVSF